jgi:hypothetical protein
MIFSVVSIEAKESVDMSQLWRVQLAHALRMLFLDRNNLHEAIVTCALSR